MPLARVHSPLSQVIIRNIGDTGGPRADQISAELDSIIAWAKLSPRCIHRNTTATGNVGAGLDSLHSFTLPAGSLAADGDYLKVRYGGTFATNDNDKRINIFLDGVNVHNTGLFDQDSGTWDYDIAYIRLTATTVRATGQLMWSFGTRDGAGTAGGNYIFAVTHATSITVANLNSNAVVLLVQAEGAANDDIVQNFSIVELCQQ